MIATLATLAFAVDRQVPGGYPTIQAALADAQDGDRIVIAAGTYTEDLDLPGRSLTLSGAGIDQTILLNGDGSTLVLVPTGVAVTIEDLTLTTTRARRCVTTDGDLVLRRVRLHDCADFGGAGGGLQVSTNGSAVVEDALFEDNGAHSGAHAYTFGRSLTLRRTELARGVASWEGGALYHTGAGTLSVEDCWIHDGIASNNGGAIVASNAGPLSIVDTRIEGNAANGAGGGLLGYYTPSVTVSGVTFEHNVAQRAAAIDLASVEAISVSRTVFCANDGGALDGGGAVGLYASGGTRSDWSNVLFLDDTSTGRGAALWLWSARANLRFATLLANDPGSYGALFAGGNSSLSVLDSVVVGTVDGYGAWVEFGSAFTSGTDAWFDNQPDHLGGSIGPANHPPSSLVDVDPMLQSMEIDCATARPWPALGSPLVDAAEPGSLDADGSPADLGAWGGPDPLCALTVSWRDLDRDGFGDVAAPERGCGLPPGNASNDLDCDDADPTAAIPRKWYPDGDGDGHGDEAAPPVSSCARPPASAAVGDDCDDGSPRVHPGAPDLPGDGIDADCDGVDPEAPGTTTDPSGPGTDDPLGAGDRTAALGEGASIRAGCGCDAPGGGASGAGLLAALALVRIRRRTHAGSAAKRR